MPILQADIHGRDPEMKRRLFALLPFLGAALLAAPPLIREWAHGWETANVRATRYTNPTIGQNIGFLFPRDPNLCDRAEIMEAIKKAGGDIYQAGGYPGAEILVKFPEVVDVPTANIRIKKILPMLDALVRGIRPNGDGK